MSDIPKNTSEVIQAPESNQDILAKQPESVRKIIENNLILSKNLNQITNPKEFFETLAQNIHIFDRTDNLSAQRTFLNQSLKGLGYGQYASNGQKFDELVVLSPDEMGKLPEKIQIELETWMDKQEQLKKGVVVSQKNEDEQLGKAVVSLDQGIAKKREAVVSRKNEDEQLGKEIAILTEKNTIAGRENKKIEETLSGNGKDLIDTQFQKEKENKNNPVYRDLIAKGIDPGKGEYDNILRASIILANADILRKESSDQGKFDSSIRELGRLGILSPVASDIPSISAHIDSRFPHTEATERAKGEIARSIESGNVSSIYYDGKGEKYTLIDKDGKTSKEVYMDPPLIRVRESTLSYAFPIYRNTEISERSKNQESLTRVQGENNARTNEFLTGLTAGENKEQKQEEILKLGKEKVDFMGIAIKKIANPNLSPEERKTGADDMKAILRNIRTIPVSLFDTEISKLEDMATGLTKEIMIKKTVSSLPPESNTPERMEEIVRKNLSLLTLHHFDAMGPDAQKALDRILRLHNIGRTRNNEIRLDKPIKTDSTDFDELKKDISKLGITQESTKSYKLVDFQRNITNMLQYNPGESRSIEGKLREKSKSETT